MRRLVFLCSTLSVLCTQRSPYVFFASATQVNAQIPVELPAGKASVVVTYQNQPSAAFSITLLPFAPAFFTFSTA